MEKFSQIVRLNWLTVGGAACHRSRLLSDHFARGAHPPRKVPALLPPPGNDPPAPPPRKDFPRERERERAKEGGRKR